MAENFTQTQTLTLLRTPDEVFHYIPPPFTRRHNNNLVKQAFLLVGSIDDPLRYCMLYDMIKLLEKLRL